MANVLKKGAKAAKEAAKAAPAKPTKKTTTPPNAGAPPALKEPAAGTASRFQKKPAGFKAWSYSRKTDYDKCPLMAKLKHIDKVEQPESEALNNGSKVHGLAEDYTLKKINRIPAALSSFKDQFKHLREQKPAVELEWAFDLNWNPCGWKDWDRAWCRVKTDANYKNYEPGLPSAPGPKILYIIDHKTGKFREENREQLKLYGLAGFIMEPEAEEIVAQFWYLDVPKLDELTFTRKDDEKNLKKYWEKATRRMLNDKTFKPTPSDSSCRFCPYKAASGGPCKY